MVRCVVKSGAKISHTRTTAVQRVKVGKLCLLWMLLLVTDVGRKVVTTGTKSFFVGMAICPVYCDGTCPGLAPPSNHGLGTIAADLGYFPPLKRKQAQSSAIYSAKVHNLSSWLYSSQDKTSPTECEVLQQFMVVREPFARDGHTIPHGASGVTVPRVDHNDRRETLP